MYINDVVRLVNAGYPSEYSPEEMYIWCDEVSSMLLVEDRQVYSEATLFCDKDGTVLLPEGVEFENVCSVTAGDTKLKKCDLRTVRPGAFALGADSAKEPLHVVYSRPYVPIRIIRYRGAVMFDTQNSCFAINDCEFMPGDTLKISVNVKSGTPDFVIDNVPLMSVIYDGADMRRYICRVGEGALCAVMCDGAEDCIIERVVTDKTVCAAPYDSMYVDYILAKINMYQRDMNAYNHHMTAFNSRLLSYRRWLVGRLPSDNGNLINWW